MTTTEPDHINLDGYYCRECGNVVSLEDSFWGCGCFQIGAYELDCGYHEKPKFWEEHPKTISKRRCEVCGKDQYRKKVWAKHYHGKVICMSCGLKYAFWLDGSVYSLTDGPSEKRKRQLND